jgi:ubiquinone/menaquinone biosynthesis C-methylase UbiE
LVDRETIRAFDADVDEHDGYVYTTVERLSSQLACERMVQTIVGLAEMRGRSLLDLGCGDGYFTRLYYDRERPASVVVAIDPAANAIAAANAKRGDREIEFRVGNGHSVPYDDKSFDIVLVQAVLHHDDDPSDIVREACRLGREIVVLEPNGYNVVLKVLEKVSPYHRRHKEKSYAPRSVDRWITGAGGRIVGRRFTNLVPMFAPDVLARACKAVEPAVERAPVLRQLCCGQYTVKALVA